MADPVTKKIDTLADLSGIAASGDKMVVIDASDTNPVTKTKLVAMNQLSIHTATQLAANVVENTQIKDAAVTGGKIAGGTITAANLATEVNQDIAKNIIYIQLFQTDEAIITVTNRTQFFVPTQLAGKQVKRIGMGIVTAETGKTVTIQLGTSGTYGSVSGEATKEEDTTKTLPGAGTKIPINVSVTTGTPAPKGLDFWFMVY